MRSEEGKAPVAARLGGKGQRSFLRICKPLRLRASLAREHAHV
jgi:hypothetical protein